MQQVSDYINAAFDWIIQQNKLLDFKVTRLTKISETMAAEIAELT